MALNNPDIDLVNVDMYTKFGQILSIHSQAIELKQNSNINQGCNSVANLQKKKVLYNPKVDLVNENEYIKFG